MKEEPKAVTIAHGSDTRSPLVTTTPSTSNNTRPDPEVVARRVNVGVAVELEAQRRRQEYARETSRRREVLCDCERDIEQLIAIVAELSIRLEGAS